MREKAALRAVVSAALLAVALPASAQIGRDLLFDRDTCYARAYSGPHLARHPVQQVTRITLMPDPIESAPDMLVLRVAIRVRNDGEGYSAAAYCENAEKDGLSCTMEGDAGAFFVTGHDEGVRLVVGDAGMSFEGEARFVTLDAHSGDDREFLLGRSEPCR